MADIFLRCFQNKTLLAELTAQEQAQAYKYAFVRAMYNQRLKSVAETIKKWHECVDARVYTCLNPEFQELCFDFTVRGGHEEMMAFGEAVNRIIIVEKACALTPELEERLTTLCFESNIARKDVRVVVG